MRNELKRVWKTITSLCLLTSAVCMMGQQYVFRAFRQTDGLNNLVINGLATDRSGFLWVATENGVYRFLGSRFRRYGLEDGLTGIDARDIVTDTHGTVWVGTDEDLFRWDGLHFVRAGSTPISVVGPRCIALEDERHLLVVDKGKLYRLEHDANGRTISYLPAIPPGLSSSRQDLERLISVSVVRNSFGDTQIWIGSGKQLYSFSRSADQRNTQVDFSAVTDWGTSKGIPADEWENVVLDHNGTIWAAGLRHVVVLQRGTTAFIERNIPGANHQGTLGHAPLLEDPQGRMLVPAGAEIARWTGDKWQFIGSTNGLTRVSALSGMTFDRSGDLFLASRGNGLYFWAGYANWEAWSSERSLPSTSIWTVVTAADHGHRVYVGTDNGPAWIDTDNGTSGHLPFEQQWGSGRIAAMGTNSDGSLWAATSPGLFLRIDPVSYRVETIANLGQGIQTGFQEPSGAVFLSTTHGLYVRKSADSRAIPERVTGADNFFGETSGINKVTSGCQAPNGATWITGNNRVVRFSDGKWTSPPIIGLPRLNGTILGLDCAKDGAVWLTGDQTGTWRLTPAKDALYASRLSLPPEWRSLSCLTIFHDRRGWLWLGTELGLLVWNGQEWRHLSEESGLISNDTNQGALREDSSGSLWIGASGGISRLLHPERVFDPIPITAALTLSQRGRTDLSHTPKIVMKEAGPPLQFEVSSPTMQNRSELSLKIRMIGMNADWIDTKDGFAGFTRLSPGNYTFMGKACNPSINACSSEVAIGVRVLPSWWNTYWFYAGCALVVSILIFAGIRLYAYHLVQRSQELEQLVRERTEELEKSRELLRVQATHDGLTGMLNREAILKVLVEEIERARRMARTFALALIDLDHFKRINDTRGHLAGDEALRVFSAALANAIRPYDHIGRYGGEEFLIVLPDLPPDAAIQRLRTLHTTISNLSVGTAESAFNFTCSFGAVTVVPTAESIGTEPLLAIADQALYEAKAAGRNRIVTKTFDSISAWTTCVNTYS